MTKYFLLLSIFISLSLNAGEKVQCPIEYEQTYTLIDGINILTLKLWSDPQKL